MNLLYDRIYWHNDTTPALNESNLNSMSKGIADIDARVVELAGDILETIPQLEEDITEAQGMIEDLQELNEHTPYIGANGNWWVWNVTQKVYEDTGVDASITVQIADITMLDANETPYVTNTGTNTDPIFHLFIPRGAGISSITKTSSAGLVDTYTITYSDGRTSTFNVVNGKSAYQAAVDGGFVGTEAEFNDQLGNFADYASTASTAAQSASQSATSAQQSAQSASQSALNAANSATDAQGYAEDAEDIKTEISGMIGAVEFSVDFTTGELIYTNDSTFIFSINQTTGNLEWEVV